MTDPYNQVVQKISDANSLLIVLPQTPTADAVAAGLALLSYTKKLDKDAVLVATSQLVNSQADFLPGFDQITREFNISKGFVVNVSTKQTALAELSYKKEADNLAIFLKPKSGEFKPEDISFSASKFPYDAVVVLGVGSLELLGEFYAKNAALFFETPVINIDHKGSNQGYGQINLLELNASSLSEIIFDLIGKMEQGMLDQNLATTLLAGIIAETNSFQHTKTTPQSFVKASQLVGLGANQQEIINQLYKNKSMGFLKLWGTVLAKLKQETEHALIYSYVTLNDLEKTGAVMKDTESVLVEMGAQLSFAKIQLFFMEQNIDQTIVYVAAPASINLTNLFAQFNPLPTAPQTVKFFVSQGMQSAQETILDALRPQAKKLIYS